jgi:ubiquinol-cytochrome c reductase cytochrome b subunit
MTANRLERSAGRTAGRIGRWLDTRLGVAHFADSVLNHVFPDNWSFMLGEIAMYCFIILVVTGTYLTFFFHASGADVVYHGRYVPLQGLHMSDAFESTLRLSFDVRAGLVIRQVHHWTADLFAAAIMAHLCRIFFTGAFRRPRELNWIIGLTMFILVIVNGFAGYSLPDDLLSATGLRIGYSIVLSIPLVGTWLASLFFGGAYPGPATTGRLFIIHVLLLPALIAALLGAHLAIVWRQKHSQYPGPGHSEHNVVGSRLWPTYTAKSVGLFAAVFAVAAALGGLAQINPIWLYGPYRTGAVSTAAQPDWYMGWLEGALRIFPPWRLHLFNHTIPEIFWPAVVLPGITFGLLYLWPFIEARVTGDHDDHELLDRPRDRPVRTAIGTGVLTFYIVLFFAGSQDIIAQHLGVHITTVDLTFRLLLFTLPLAVGAIAWKWCHDLAAVSASAADSDGQPLLPPEQPPPSASGPGGGEKAPSGPDVVRSTLVRRIAVAALAAFIAAIGRLLERRRREDNARR